MKDVVFVTGNEAKARYFSRLVGFSVSHQRLELEEIQSTDIKKITEDKARKAFDKVGLPVIVEDVGLYFEAWGELPGPFIKFFVEQENGLENLCRMLDSFTTRKARTVVVTTYYDGKTFTHFVGGSDGQISHHPIGKGGFGYDAIWCVEGYDGRTRAELTEAEDDESYRQARPLADMQDFFGDMHE